MMRTLDVAGWSGSGAGAGMVDREDMPAISCTTELVAILPCIIDEGCRRLAYRVLTFLLAYKFIKYMSECTSGHPTVVKQVVDYVNDSYPTPHATRK